MVNPGSPELWENISNCIFPKATNWKRHTCKVKNCLAEEDMVTELENEKNNNDENEVLNVD